MMNNTLIINTNKKRINLLKNQIKILEELKIDKITKEEVLDIKKGAHKLIAKLWFIPVSIILTLTFLISELFFIEGVIFSIMYFIVLIPTHFITNHIIDFMYDKELNENLEIEYSIQEKEKEIKKLIKYNKTLKSNNLTKQSDSIINEPTQKEKVYTYTKKNKISHK